MPMLYSSGRRVPSSRLAWKRRKRGSAATCCRCRRALPRRCGSWRAPIAPGSPPVPRPPLVGAPARRAARLWPPVAARSHPPLRLALLGSTPAALVEQLSAFLEGHQQPRATLAPPGPPPAVVFVCAGQGGQWAEMAHSLLAHQPICPSVFAQVPAALQPHLHCDLLALVTGSDSSWLERIDVLQPALFALQLALAALWQAWGVQPAALVGHSLGEVAAAYLAGALSLTDAATVIARRARLLQ